MDFDPANLERTARPASNAGENFELFHSNFAAPACPSWSERDFNVDGILADLGVASPQIDDPAAGFPIPPPARSTCAWTPPADNPPPRCRQSPWRKRTGRRVSRTGRRNRRPANRPADCRAPKRQTDRHHRRPDGRSFCEARDFTLKHAVGAENFTQPPAPFRASAILVNRELANLDAC